jgi:iron complex outermembrane recepter protein
MFDSTLLLWLALWFRHDAVVVTGTPEPIPLGEADRAVRSLSVQGQSILFGDLAAVLQLDPALDLRQRGPGGVQADVSIRGASYSQTLVLWNGRRMNDSQSAHHNLDLPVPLESVAAVEVLRGAGSSLYGADAWAES